MGSKITIGLIGVGDIVTQHLDAIQANSEYHLMGICRRSPEKLKKQASELGVKGYIDYRDMLVDRPDVVLVSLPHDLHYSVAMDCFDAGCHILLEKPIAVSMNEINGIIAAAEKSGRAVMVTESSYWQPEFRTAREIVRCGELGKFLFANYINHRFYFHEGRPNWFLNSRQSGGGQFMNIGVHRTSAVRCILGDDYEEVSVTASVHRIHPEYNIESATKAMVMYASGQAVTYEECGYHAPPEELPRGLHFVFEKGILGITNGCVWTSDSSGDVVYHKMISAAKGGAYGSIYGQMLKAIDGQDHYPTIRHGAKDVRIALAAYLSAEQHKTVNLGEKCWIIRQFLQESEHDPKRTNFRGTASSKNRQVAFLPGDL